MKHFKELWNWPRSRKTSWSKVTQRNTGSSAWGRISRTRSDSGLHYDSLWLVWSDLYILSLMFNSFPVSHKVKDCFISDSVEFFGLCLFSPLSVDLQRLYAEQQNRRPVRILVWYTALFFLFIQPLFSQGGPLRLSFTIKPSVKCREKIPDMKHKQEAGDKKWKGQISKIIKPIINKTGESTKTFGVK